MKLFKKLAVILAAVTAVVCMAAFAAGCNKDTGGNNGGGNGGGSATTIEITVKDENGNVIDGTTFGEGDYDSNLKQVSVQFCTTGNGGSCMSPENLGANGKVSLDYENLKTKVLALPDTTESTVLELHILNVQKKGYKVAYGQYPLNEIPSTIEITLEKA